MRPAPPLRVLAAALLAATLLPFAAAAALAQARHALVIGNDGYTEVPRLQKAVNDAIAITDALTAQGFEVATLTDAPRREMNRAISDFTEKLRAGDTALVFYAGHGVEIDGENYLLPVDIEAPRSGDAEFVKAESIALSRLLDQVRATGARTTLAIVDACRENPFAQATGRSIGTARGLGRVAAPEGTFVIFSAGAGQLALDRLSDGDGNRNSVFTRSLLPRLAEPDLELREMVAEVRRDVRDLAASVGHRQFPAYYDELLGDFYLVPAGLAPAAPPPPAAADDPIRRDFDLAREIGTPEALGAFLDRYGDRGDAFEVSLARQLLAAVPAAEAAAAETGGQAAPDPGDTVAAVEPGRAMREPGTGGEAPVAAPEAEAIALIRATQEELNRLGCDAGSADGVAGPQTRTAYARFLAGMRGSGLGAADLGSEAALAAMRGQSGRVCRAPAVQAPPAAAPAPAPVAPGADLAGYWALNTRCPLSSPVSGSVTWQRAGAGFAGSTRDNRGQRGSASATVSGRAITGRYVVGSRGDAWQATFSSSGNSYSGRTESGCRFTASR